MVASVVVAVAVVDVVLLAAAAAGREQDAAATARIGRMRLRLTSSTTVPTFRAGRRSRGSARSRGRSARRSARSTRGYDDLAVAGRTDAGVHALGQVASVEVEGGPPAANAAEALNTVLPDDLAVIAAETEAAGDFDARRSARSRTYRYRIWRRRTPSPFEQRRSWWMPRPVRGAELADSADLLVGEHDFRAFTPTETQHVVFQARGAGRRLAPPRRRARARDHRRQLPPAHGADAGRDDGRAGPEEIAQAARGPPPVGGRLDRAALGAVPRLGRVLEGPPALAAEEEPVADAVPARQAGRRRRARDPAAPSRAAVAEHPRLRLDPAARPRVAGAEDRDRAAGRRSG